MKIKNEEYAQRFLPLPNGHTLPKCKVIKTFLNWLNEIAVIKGNNYRLIVVIVFFAGTVAIRFIGTHSEYDKIKDIKNI
jgi:mRNA-degrading endonuclease HigB of HigAB toxin-antitoxin module